MPKVEFFTVRLQIWKIVYRLWFLYFYCNSQTENTGGKDTVSFLLRNRIAFQEADFVFRRTQKRDSFVEKISGATMRSRSAFFLCILGRMFTYFGSKSLYFN